MHYEGNTDISSDSSNDRVYNRGIVRLRSSERIERLEVDRVVKLCLKENIKSVLDIGTGSGLFAEAFHKAGMKVAGIDSNPAMIEAAKQYIIDSEFHISPAEDIPFKDKSFDLTFFGVVFHEVNDYSKAMKEAFRVSVYGTSILEWQYREENFGPPLEHRLKSEFIKELSTESGYKNFQETKLNELILYNLIK